MSDVWKQNFTPEQIRLRQRRDDFVCGDGWFRVQARNGWVCEHHLVMGKPPSGYVWHHLDGDKPPENLELLTNSEHRRQHQLEGVTTIPRGVDGKFIRRSATHPQQG